MPVLQIGKEKTMYIGNATRISINFKQVARKFEETKLNVVARLL